MTVQTIKGLISSHFKSSRTEDEQEGSPLPSSHLGEAVGILGMLMFSRFFSKPILLFSTTDRASSFVLDKK